MTDTPTPRTDSAARKIVWVESDGGCVNVAVVQADFARELERDLTACRAALRELVACKDLWDDIEREREACQFGLPAGKGWWDKVDDHARRKPLAWSVARALVGQEGDGHAD